MFPYLKQHLVRAYPGFERLPPLTHISLYRLGIATSPSVARQHLLDLEGAPNLMRRIGADLVYKAMNNVSSG